MRRRTIAAVLAGLALTTASLVTWAPSALADTGGYPYANAVNCSAKYGPDSWCIDGYDISPYGYAYRNCTDYVAWKIQQALGVTLPRNLGNADTWGSRLKNDGYPFDSSPRVGDIAAWNNAAGGFGHVAYVYAVSNGVASLDEYNVANTGLFSSNRTTASKSAGAPSEFIHIRNAPSESDQVIDVQKVNEPGGTQQIYATTSSDVYQSWWNSTSNGVVTGRLIEIAQNNIVDSHEVDAPGGEQELYTATTNGIWETNWSSSESPTSGEIISGLSGVKKVIARTEDDSGTTTFQLYVMTSHGVYQYWWNAHSDGIHSIELYSAGNPLDISFSTNGGADQVYTAYPGYVEETWWHPGGSINDDKVITISQDNITAIAKIIGPHGTNILAVATTVGEWDAEWGGSVGKLVYHYEVNNFSGSVAVARQVDSGPTQLLYLANGSKVQQYKWGANSGGGTAINISQNDIRAIVSDNYDGTDQLYTAAGNTVWETYYIDGAPKTDMIVNINQQQG